MAPPTITRRNIAVLTTVAVQNRRRCSCKSSVLQKLRQHAPGVELLLRDGARRGGVVAVIGLDGGKGGLDVVEAAEGKQAGAGGIVSAEPGVLYDHRLAERQVGCAAGAEPATRAGDVGVLRNAPLPPRLL